MVVGLSAAAGKEDLLRTRAEERSNVLAGGFDSGAGLLAKSMDRGSVAEFHREIRKHGVEHSRLDGRRGVVIEVDAVHELGTFRIALWRREVKEVRDVRTL